MTPHARHRREAHTRSRAVIIGAVAGLFGGAAWANAVSAEASAAVTVSVPCSPNTSGGGPAGLIAAINEANAQGGGTIALALGCTYTLGPHADNDGNGLPVVRTPITINGNGSTIARSAAIGTADFRIFEVVGPGNLTLDLVTVSNGRSSGGGGILGDNGGTLTLNESRVTNNSVASVLLGQTKAFGGGISIDHGAALTLNGSRVDHNSAGAASVTGGGGLQEDDDSSSTLNASRVDHNSVSASSVAVGGGIALNFGSGARVMALHSSQVDDNVVTASGNGPNALARGGGIESNGTMVTMSSSLVVDNSVSAPGGSGLGGGIHNSTAKDGTPYPNGLFALTSSRVTGNTASGRLAGGGGASNQIGALRLTSSAVTGNTVTAGDGGADGGGVENLPIAPAVTVPELTMSTTAVGSNTVTASSQIPGANASACGGGLFNSGSTTVSLSSITANRATGTPAKGGGIFNASSLALTASLVSGNIPDNRADGSAASCGR